MASELDACMNVLLTEELRGLNDSMDPRNVAGVAVSKTQSVLAVLQVEEPAASERAVVLHVLGARRASCSCC